jgi:hypothetical protein
MNANIPPPLERFVPRAIQFKSIHGSRSQLIENVLTKRDNVKQLLEQTIASGLQISLMWNGESISNANEKLQNESNISKNLNFVNSHLKKPFSGINILRSAIKKPKNLGICSLQLLLCLEFISLKNLKEADNSLHLYIDKIKLVDEEAHPLLLIALSRIEKIKFPAKTIYEDLINLFNSLYPGARKWFSDDEAQLLDVNTIAGNTHQNIRKAKTLLDEWNEMKRKEGYSSSAMDELLKMIGLKKVKQYAFNLFRTAISINKMSPSDRQKNMISL